MGLYLHNTLTNQLERFQPTSGNGSPVKLYCCGPTVYTTAHIGNMRTYLFEDFLRRTLEYLDYPVTHVMNITDVGHLMGDGEEGEDKVVAAAREQGMTVVEIGDLFTKLFFEDAIKLNIIRPHCTPKATDYVAAMIHNIEQLVAKGLAYQAGGNVYFDVAQFPDYYGLSHLEPHQGVVHRVTVDSHKRDPRDFVLWFTQSKFDGQAMQWDSPWGRGYMGWHIECSAMARELLGDEIDIHCGGVDHIRVHHTNERAQAEGITGRPWVKIWLHGEFLITGKGQKMSKSIGSFVCVKDLETSGYSALDYRYLCLGTHYRKQLSFDLDVLKSAQTARRKLKRQCLELGLDIVEEDSNLMLTYERGFREAIERDLNVPQALALVWKILKDAALLPSQKRVLIARWDQILGLDLLSLEATGEGPSLPTEIEILWKEWSVARSLKDFARADEIRKFCRETGYILSPEGVQR